MRLPTKLQIAGITFKVKYVPDLASETHPGQLYGDCDVDERVIRINKVLHKTAGEYRATLLHESLHAALRVTGWAEVLGDKQEEALIQALENALFKDLKKIASI